MSAPIPVDPPCPDGTCPLCWPYGGLGYIKIFCDDGPYHSGKQRYRLERCQCKAQEDATRNRQHSKAASEFTPRMADLTFGTFIHQRQPDAFRACYAFAKNPQSWLYLTSAPGRGKTHLLAAIYNSLLADGDMAIYTTVPDLLAFIRAGFDSESKRLSDSAAARLETYRRAKVLLLDDLGAEKSTEWAIEQVYLILDHRYREQMPTVIASNLGPDALPAEMMRVADRFQDVRFCKIIRLGGESYRKNPTGRKVA